MTRLPLTNCTPPATPSNRKYYQYLNSFRRNGQAQVRYHAKKERQLIAEGKFGEIAKPADMIGDFPPSSKAEIIAEIMRLTGKGEAAATRCLKDDLSKRGAVTYDERTNTWRGWRVESAVLLMAKFSYREDLYPSSLSQVVIQNFKLQTFATTLSEFRIFVAFQMFRSTSSSQ